MKLLFRAIVSMLWETLLFVGVVARMVKLQEQDKVRKHRQQYHGE